MNKILIRSLNTLFGVSSVALAIFLIASPQQAQAQGPAPCANVIDESDKCVDGGKKTVGRPVFYCVAVSTGCCQYLRREEGCDYPDLGVHTGSGWKAYYQGFSFGGECIGGLCTGATEDSTP